MAIMDQQNIVFIGGLTLAIVVTVYLLWGPTPYARKKKGAIVGLVNLGSTCFLNTLLQALASCSLLVEWLDQQTSEGKTLTSSLQNILWILNGQSEANTHSPEAILTVLRRHGWVMPPGEQDAHELFHCIVSTLQEENSKAPKAVSLSDALPPSDTLSQASDILEDPFESLEPEGVTDIPQEETLGDAMSEPSSLSLYEDMSNRGDSEQFYSVDSREPEDDSSRTLKLQSPRKLADTDSLKRGVVARSGASPPFSASESPPFTGLLASSLTCCACGHASSVRTDTFDSVSLALGEAPSLARHTLTDLVRRFVRTEIVPDVHCEKCVTNTSALKTYNFGKLPPCLCFHIVRTAWHSSSGTSSKREDHVDFPEYLVMDPFTWRPGASPPAVPTAVTAKHLYRLKSVVVHVGSVASGHFLTFRRGPLNSTRRHMLDDKLRSCVDSTSWYVASDESVHLSTMSRAMDSLAYMLFYEKCSLDIRASLLGEISTS